jgi:hypothetical protein
MQLSYFVTLGVFVVPSLAVSQATSGSAGRPPALRGVSSPYSVATSLDGPLRAARNALFDGKSGESALSSSSPARRMTYQPSFVRLDAIPVSGAAAVVTGHATRGTSYFSNDRTTIYSEFSVKIDQILFNASGKPLTGGSAIDLVRPGGVISMPGGGRLIRGCPQEAMPRRVPQYLFVLSYTHQADVFPIVAGFEMAGNSVYMLEEVISPSKGTAVLGALGLTPDQLVQAVQAALARH